MIHFDCGAPGWRAYELGVFFWSMSISAERAEVWDQVMTGYHARRSIAQTELATIPTFAAVRAMWLMGLWCANAHVFGYHKLHADDLGRQLNQIEQFYAQAVQSLL